MRISFLGKGGSGKTTLASTFIKYLSEKQFVLAIDADINSHLQETLNLEGKKIEIGSRFREISDYLKGSRDDLQNTRIVATTPPSLKSNFIKPNVEDTFLKEHAIISNNIALLNIGSYQPEDVGHTCYHGKLNTLELIYHHLLDSRGDLVVADATAGVDNLGTSLFMAYDLNIFVVEPTLKSIRVYKDFVDKSKKYNLKTKVIVNKYQKFDQQFISNHISSEEILGFVDLDLDFHMYEQGDKKYQNNFIDNNKKLFSEMYLYIQSLDKNWNEYLEKLIHVHKQNSLEWWDDYYNQKISDQLDPNFQYTKTF